MTQIQIKQRPYLTRPENIQGVSPFIAQILARRGVQSEQELEFKLKHLLAPNMKGLEQAIGKFIVKQNQPVYPDSLVWMRDYSYSYNEPLTRLYFSFIFV